MLVRFLLPRVVTSGRLTLVDSAGRSHSVGPGGKPNVTMRLHGRSASWRLCVNPWLRIGEAYIDGSLSIEQGTLSEFLYLPTSGAEAFDRHPIQTIGKWVRWPLHYARQFNPVGKPRANVAHHYDPSHSLDRIEELYDERFCRMWEVYLAGCEVAFRYNRMMVFQVQLAHRPDAVPLSRDYVVDWEREQRPASIRAA